MAAIAFALTRSTPEPKYEGKPLSYWLDLFANPPEDETKKSAETALTQIGTNAYPFFADWIRYEPLQAVTFAAGKWQWKPFVALVNRDLFRKQQVCAYFYWKRQHARGVIPLLSNIVVSARTDSAPVGYALAALRSIGDEGSVPVISLLANTTTSPDLRMRCLIYLIDDYNNINERGPDERAQIGHVILQSLGPALVYSTNNAENDFGGRVAVIIRSLAPDLLTNSPASN